VKLKTVECVVAPNVTTKDGSTFICTAAVPLTLLSCVKTLLTVLFTHDKCTSLLDATVWGRGLALSKSRKLANETKTERNSFKK